MDWTDVRQALRIAVGGWLYDPNVTYVDFGYRITGGKLLEYEAPCIRIHVREKLPPGRRLEAAIEQNQTGGVIPRSIAGIGVDVPRGAYQPKWASSPGVRPVAPPSRRPPRERRRSPLSGGISISDGNRPIAGTLGGAVLDRVTGRRMLLSNWHVLVGPTGQPGQPIRQPGRGDGGGPGDTIGALVRHGMAVNVDAALAELRGDRDVVNDQFELGPVQGTTVAQLGMDVVKSGRTTGVTRGRVTGVEGTQKMNYGAIGNRLIRDVVTVGPLGSGEVSLPGDSGSLWLDDASRKVVGLHFAGNVAGQPEEALMIDISSILDALQVDLLV